MFLGLGRAQGQLNLKCLFVVIMWEFLEAPFRGLFSETATLESVLGLVGIGSLSADACGSQTRMYMNP